MKKKCEHRGHRAKCHIQKTCGLLGECFLGHSKVIQFGSPMQERIKNAKSFKDTVKLMEEMNPRISRVRRRSFKPDYQLEPEKISVEDLNTVYKTWLEKYNAEPEPNFHY